MEAATGRLKQAVTSGVFEAGGHLRASMSGSSFLVAVNALLLKRTKLEGIRRYGAQ